jgi:SAM-dependent methyltransferase
MKGEAVSQDAVRWAYRLFLGREPESTHVVEGTINGCTDVAALRRAFIGSAEFAQHLPPRGTGLGGMEPVRVVESSGPSELLAQLFEHVNRSWQFLGETDPYWSVLTSPEFRGTPSSSDIDRFFSSGKAAVEGLQKALDRCGLSLKGRRTCVEYGCGLGRITRSLAPHFERTVGVDISAAHLALARKLAEQAGIAGIEWLQLPTIDSLELLPEADLIYSVIVLQHNPPPVIERILTRFARILRPGGVAFFQVPTYRADYEFRLQDYMRDQVGRKEMEMHVYPQERIFNIFAEHGVHPVSVIEDGATGFRSGERSNTFIFEKR